MNKNIGELIKQKRTENKMTLKDISEATDLIHWIFITAGTRININCSRHIKKSRKGIKCRNDLLHGSAKIKRKSSAKKLRKRNS